MCSLINQYRDYRVFNETFNSVECNIILSGILKKGIKTSFISFLQEIRAVMSQYPSAVPGTVQVSKAIESEQITKYI